jgi:hypothetical protein
MDRTFPVLFFSSGTDSSPYGLDWNVWRNVGVVSPSQNFLFIRVSSLFCYYISETTKSKPRVSQYAEQLREYRGIGKGSLLVIPQYRVFHNPPISFPLACGSLVCSMRFIIFLSISCLSHIRTRLPDCRQCAWQLLDTYKPVKSSTAGSTPGVLNLY